MWFSKIGIEPWPQKCMQICGSSQYNVQHSTWSVSVVPVQICPLERPPKKGISTTLPETNIAHEHPPFWWYLPGNMGIFMGYVSFREGIYSWLLLWLSWSQVGRNPKRTPNMSNFCEHLEQFLCIWLPLSKLKHHWWSQPDTWITPGCLNERTCFSRKKNQNIFGIILITQRRLVLVFLSWFRWEPEASIKTDCSRVLCLFMSLISKATNRFSNTSSPKKSKWYGCVDPTLECDVNILHVHDWLSPIFWKTIYTKSVGGLWRSPLWTSSWHPKMIREWLVGGFSPTRLKSI